MTGLPEIIIEFKGKASSAINRSARGTVALLLKDDTASEKEYIFEDLSKVNKEEWTSENYDLLAKTFLGTPSKVMVIPLKSSAVDYSEGLSILENRRFDYLAVPSASEEEKTAIASWIKAERANKKASKVVLSNVAADDEGVINFTSEGIKVGEKTYSASDYTARIAGILAGLSLSRSATYAVLNEVKDITTKDDPNACVSAGELILINDGEKVKIARAVNSLTTIAEPKNMAWKKIKIIEGMDMIQRDITQTYADNYVGKIPNTYENKLLFFTAVDTYFAGLERDNVLDISYDNKLDIDRVAHEELMALAGFNPSEMKEKTIREYNTGSTVYATGQVKFLDAMEDLKLILAM